MQTDLAARDDDIRASAFAYVDAIAAQSGGLITRDQLSAFTFEGQRIPLVGQPGIRKPAGLVAAISILTTYTKDPRDAPYADDIGEEGYLRYKWRKEDGNHSDNRSLREAMVTGKPLLYLIGAAKSTYLPRKVWLVAEEPDQHQFVVSLDGDLAQQWADVTHPIDELARRRYAEHIVKTRLHQPLFRQRVLLAYEHQCSLCKLRHTELLDAAHIKEDSDGGLPTVTNGLSMCAIHHRAFDSLILGVTPDYKVKVREDIMDEADGPTLKYSLQGLDGGKIIVPRPAAARPDKALLDERFQRFRAAS